MIGRQNETAKPMARPAIKTRAGLKVERIGYDFRMRTRGRSSQRSRTLAGRLGRNRGVSEIGGGPSVVVVARGQHVEDPMRVGTHDAGGKSAEPIHAGVFPEKLPRDGQPWMIGIAVETGGIAVAVS